MQKPKTPEHPVLFHYTRIMGKKNIPLIVGDFFEEATKHLLTKHYKMWTQRYSVDPTESVSPDLIDSTGNWYIESKASLLKSSAKIRPEQLANYNDLCLYHFPDINDPNPQFVKDALFFFWFYEIDKFPGKIVIESLRKKLASGCVTCYCLRLEDINKMVEEKLSFSPKNLNIYMQKHPYYFSYKLVDDIAVYSEKLLPFYLLGEIPHVST